MKISVEELAKSVGAMNIQDTRGWGDFHNGFQFTRESTEQFVKLIAEECVIVLQGRFMGDLNREDMEVRRCIEAVKDHFGI
jgi:hypothetical protein